MQAWFDASTDYRYFALAGYLAPIENWGEFSHDWKAVLDWSHEPYEPLLAFKMGQVNLNYAPDVERCAALYAVIEKHVCASLSVTINIDDLNTACKTVAIPKHFTKQHELRNPYFFGLTGVYDQLLKNEETLKPPIEVLFDNQSEYDRIMKAWKYASASGSPSFNKMKGSPPTFRDDATNLPLQAADMLAWWVRKWETDGYWKDGPKQIVFPWKKTRSMNHYYLRLQEPDISENLRKHFNV